MNIGSGDGYYAVGIALRAPNARIIAYDLTPVKQECLADMAALNGVRDRIDIRGACTAQELAMLNFDSVLVVCDCEGAEEDILNPQFVPWLRHATMIVELHDFYRPQATEILTARFQNSHQLQILKEYPRDPSRYQILDGESSINSRMATREDRVANGEPTKAVWGIWTPCTAK